MQTNWKKAHVTLPDPWPRFCTQSEALCERLAKEFGGTGLPTPADYYAAIKIRSGY